MPLAEDRYSKPAIFFHWAILALVALACLAIEVRGPKGSAIRAFWMDVHFWAGTLVLALAALRLIWRLWHGAPPDIDVNVLFRFLARLVHLSLYLFIFVQPLLGILMVNTAGYPVTLAPTTLHLTLVSADPAAHQALHIAHVLLGKTFYAVIGLHALAAIMHHVLLRDNTLRRIT